MKKLNIENYNIKIIECTSFLGKAKGLMFQKNINYALKLRCNGIHTFFMKKPIDIILTDKEDNIIKIFYNVKPFKIILPIKKVYYTYEFPVGIIEKKETN